MSDAAFDDLRVASMDLIFALQPANCIMRVYSQTYRLIIASGFCAHSCTMQVLTCVLGAP
jgi:hypothetical protein